MGVSCNGGTQQPWIFRLKMIILGCEMGVPPFLETPISINGFFRKHVIVPTSDVEVIWGLPSCSNYKFYMDTLPCISVGINAFH